MKKDFMLIAELHKSPNNSYSCVINKYVYRLFTNTFQLWDFYDFSKGSLSDCFDFIEKIFNEASKEYEHLVIEFI